MLVSVFVGVQQSGIYALKISLLFHLPFHVAHTHTYIPHVTPHTYHTHHMSHLTHTIHTTHTTHLTLHPHIPHTSHTTPHTSHIPHPHTAITIQFTSSVFAADYDPTIGKLYLTDSCRIDTHTHTHTHTCSSE